MFFDGVWVLRHLPYINAFLVIAEEGSISRAAQRLGVSASTASSYLDALEAHLGGKLFIRSTRKLFLTDLGSFYDKMMRPVFSQMIKVDQLALDHHNSPQGLLKVTAGVAIGRLWIAPILGEFAAQEPDLRIHLDLDDQFRSLLEDGYHLAIRAGASHEKDLIQRKLAQDQSVLVASPHYLAHAPPLNMPHDLTDHSLLLHAEDVDHCRALRFRIEGESKSINFESRLTSNNAELLKIWAIEGYGIAQKSFWEVSDAVAEGALVRLLQAYEPEPTNLYAMSHFRAGESVKVDVFVNFLRSMMARDLSHFPSLGEERAQRDDTERLRADL